MCLELLHNTTGEDVDLQEENVQLKNENKNLRAALAAIDSEFDTLSCK